VQFYSLPYSLDPFLCSWFSLVKEWTNPRLRSTFKILRFWHQLLLLFDKHL